MWENGMCVFVYAAAGKENTFHPLGNGWVQSEHRRPYLEEASALLIITELIKLGTGEGPHAGSGATSVCREFPSCWGMRASISRGRVFVPKLTVPMGK